MEASDDAGVDREGMVVLDELAVDPGLEEVAPLVGLGHEAPPVCVSRKLHQLDFGNGGGTNLHFLPTWGRGPLFYTQSPPEFPTKSTVTHLWPT